MLHDNKTQKLYSIADMLALTQYSWLSKNMLRHYVYQSEDRFAANGSITPGNGLKKAIVKIGRKVLIDIEAFDEWIEAHRLEAAE